MAINPLVTFGGPFGIIAGIAIEGIRRTRDRRPVTGIFQQLGDAIRSQITPLPVAPTPGINPTAPPIQTPAYGNEIFEELLRRPPTGTAPTPRTDQIFEDLLNRPRSSAPPPSEFEELLRRKPYAAAPGSLAWVLARAAGLLALLYPTPTASDDTISEEELRRRVNERARRRPRGRPRPGDAEPFPFPDVTGPSIPDRPIYGTPTPAPRPPGSTFPVNTWPFPNPQTLPRPRPTPRARPAPRPGPRTMAGPSTSVDPFRFSLPLPSANPAPTTGTIPDILSLASPGQPIRPFDQLRETDRWPQPLTLAQPMGLGSPSPPDNCSCSSSRSKPKRKKKRRTECYRGTYVEKASGLTKTPREKIKCQ